MTTAATVRKRRKWPFRVLWSFLAVIVGVCLFWSWSYRSALVERDALIAELRAKGEPVWWDEVADKLLNRSWEGTGAKSFREASLKLGWPIAKTGPRLPTKALEDELKGREFEPTIHAGVQNELALAEPALEALKRAVALPPGLITLALRNEEPCSIVLDDIQQGRKLQTMLRWQSYDAIAKGDFERAFDAAWTSLALSEQYSCEPFAITQLVRVVIFSKGIEQLGMCLNYGTPSRRQLARIDALLRTREDGFELAKALSGERAMWLTTLDQPKVVWVLTMNSRRSRPATGLATKIQEWWFDIVASPIGRPILLRTQSEFLQVFDRLAPMIDDSSADPPAFAREVDRFAKSNTLCRAAGTSDDNNMQVLLKLGNRCRSTHRSIVFARLAIRLRRYFDQNGRLPEKLEEVCDETMPKIRLEWFQNQPIVYKPSANGFRLEAPESILPPEERAKVHETPISGDYGLEIEFKTIKPAKGGEK